MLTESAFKIKGVYSFAVYPTAIIGNDFRNVQVLAIMDFDTVSGYVDIYPVAEQVYSSLPSGTPRNPRDYSYLKLKLPNGGITYVGIPWINDSSLESYSSTVIDVTITGKLPSDTAIIAAALKSNGITEFEIKIRQ